MTNSFEARLNVSVACWAAPPSDKESSREAAAVPNVTSASNASKSFIAAAGDTFNKSKATAEQVAMERMINIHVRERRADPLEILGDAKKPVASARQTSSSASCKLTECLSFAAPGQRCKQFRWKMVP